MLSGYGDCAVKATYSLDPGTVCRLEEIARHWGVSKSEALRRAIRAAAVGPAAGPSEPLAALATADGADFTRFVPHGLRLATAWRRAHERLRRDRVSTAPPSRVAPCGTSGGYTERRRRRG
jgi:hypothetical protein